VKPKFIDGRCGHRHYTRWLVMIQKHVDEVCTEWKADPFLFFTAVDKLGPCPPGHYTLGRVDPGAPFASGNLAWVTRRTIALRRWGVC
jgi:hypothetical protein